MKKSLLFVAAVATSMVASANVMQVSNFVNTHGQDEISNEPVQVVAVNKAKKAPAVKADAKDVAGTYVLATSNNYGTKHTNYNDKVQAAYEVVIEQAEDGSFVVSNLMSPLTGKACPVTATFADGVLTIAPDQVMDTNATYGKIVLANADDYVNSSSSTLVRTPITFAMNENGDLVQTTGNGLIRAIPDYSTGNYNLTPYHSKAVVLKKANATFEAFDYDDNVEVSYALCVEENEQGNGGVVYGIENGYVSYTVNADGDVTFGQEGIAYSTNYGQGSTYSFGMGSLSPIVWDSDDTGAYKWHYYTLASSPTGMPALEGLQIEEGNDVTIYTEPFAVFAYSSQYGGLRFSSYLAAPNDRGMGATIKFSRPVEPTAVNDINVAKTVKAQKVMENGQVLILVGDKKYNVMGAEVK